MLTYPDIDPAIVRIGDFAIHWYGMMYLIGFLGGWWRRAPRVGLAAGGGG